MKNKKSLIVIVSIIALVVITIATFVLTDNKELQNEVTKKAVDTITDFATYEMTEEEISQLSSTQIIEQTEQQEQQVASEQTVESENFELQGEIAYEGDKAKSWNVELGDYKALTYYSQLDSRWASQPYTSKGDSSQTIGSSGCAPTTASMIVTATKGTITPDKMSKLFVENGYRSANNGTYLSAFRAVADEFNIDYEETTNLDNAVNLLKDNNYLAVSCANGLFTTGGHLIMIYGIDGNTLKIYDPYLYSGKFETSTRRNKVSVIGNTVYCSIDNFRKYANATHYYAYKHDSNVPTNNTNPVITSSYTRYVKANGGLNVRNKPNGTKIGALINGSQVTVYETSGTWSRIGTNRWVSSIYLVSSITNSTSTSGKRYSTGTYKVTASLLNVRTGAGTKYKAKKYTQLSSNARTQNKKLGNSKANGYKKGVVCTVTKVSGNWGYTKSGWICLDYCKKI